MTVEKGRRFLRASADFSRRKFLCRHPNYFCNRLRHYGLDPVEALNSAFGAPAIKQRLSILPGRNVSKRSTNFIGIENARCVAMRIEMDQSARLVQIDILCQPVKRACVIVLDINRQNTRSRG